MSDAKPDDWVSDRIALQDVMCRYAAAVDERDFDMYRACFADDAEIVGFTKETVHGGDAWLDFVKNALEGHDATQHMLGPQLATIDGDRAHARTDVQALHYLKDSPGSTLTLWATYETDLARIEGAWRITRHQLVPRGTRIDPPVPTRQSD
ncbi:MAG: nuclear transport factor 2 family protein [Pseudomonadales bacterium]|jgi:ketosteroid isomerase-like protein|nr:nuclear transport factor 2 family protein [Pseudomonadales bacterium]MDP6472366.1 nuclear transport factor 2 family protein [Pseudomonadales bacterium]MDP6828162.1 nuclear transport factor 2 family protein [Pseudomonadales bacterium]MDP6973453.1 nuclear transport factor 2 family protein [Pseudomonadales bacterium]